MFGTPGPESYGQSVPLALVLASRMALGIEPNHLGPNSSAREVAGMGMEGFGLNVCCLKGALPLGGGLVSKRRGLGGYSDD